MLNFAGNATTTKPSNFVANPLAPVTVRRVHGPLYCLGEIGKYRMPC